MLDTIPIWSCWPFTVMRLVLLASSFSCILMSWVEYLLISAILDPPLPIIAPIFSLHMFEVKYCFWSIYLIIINVNFFRPVRRFIGGQFRLETVQTGVSKKNGWIILVDCRHGPAKLLEVMLWKSRSHWGGHVGRHSRRLGMRGAPILTVLPVLPLVIDPGRHCVLLLRKVLNVVIRISTVHKGHKIVSKICLLRQFFYWISNIMFSHWEVYVQSRKSNSQKELIQDLLSWYVADCRKG